MKYVNKIITSITFGICFHDSWDRIRLMFYQLAFPVEWIPYEWWWIFSFDVYAKWQMIYWFWIDYNHQSVIGMQKAQTN